MMRPRVVAVGFALALALALGLLAHTARPQPHLASSLSASALAPFTPLRAARATTGVGRARCLSSSSPGELHRLGPLGLQTPLHRRRQHPPGLQWIPVRRLAAQSSIDWDFDDDEEEDPGRKQMRQNRMLHSVFLVKNLDEIVNFCTQALGMKVLRTRELPEQGATSVYVGYGEEGKCFTIQWYGKPDAPGFDLGDAFSGFGVTLPHSSPTDILNPGKIQALGGAVADPMSDWELGPNMIPDEELSTKKIIQRGYAYGPAKTLFEINNGTVRDPMTKLRLRVADLEKSIKFYEALGMRLHQKRSHLNDIPYDTRLSATMSFGDDETDDACLELMYLYATRELDVGEKFRQLSVMTENVTEAVRIMREEGHTILREPAAAKGIGTEVAALKDPDGYTVVLVSAEDFRAEVEGAKAETANSK